MIPDNIVILRNESDENRPKVMENQKQLLTMWINKFILDCHEATKHAKYQYTKVLECEQFSLLKQADVVEAITERVPWSKVGIHSPGKLRVSLIWRHDYVGE